MSAIALVANMIAPGGEPASGCKLNSYVRSTTTRSPLYSNVGLSTPTTNPYVGDSDGRLEFYFDSAIEYSWSVTTSDGATVLWEADVVGGVVSVTYTNGILIDSTWAQPLATAAGARWGTHLGKPLPWFFAADYGVVADGTTNDAVNFQAAWDACAAAGGGILWVPEGTMKFTTAITLNGSYVTVRGMGQKTSTISSTYAVGPAIILGNNTTQTVGYAFEDMGFVGVAGQTFFKPRYVRGLYFRRYYESTDRFLWVGDSAAGTSKPTYVVHLEGCPDSAHLAGGTPTLHHIYWENFAGQWVANNTFVEGQYTAGLDGIYATDNIQTRVDHVVISGGYFSRFRDSYSFVDARVVNAHFSIDHESELALRNAIRFEVTTSTAKGEGLVGWSNIFIAGKYSSTGGNSIYMKCERAGVVDCGTTTIGPVVFTSSCAYTPIIIESLVGSIVGHNIGAMSLEITPADASQDAVKIVGGTSAATIEAMTIGNITGKANTTALRSVVRVEGITSKVVRPKNISVKNATVALSDVRLAVLDEYEYIQPPEGRLTLTSATPVLSSSVTAATSIYYTPYVGSRIPLLTESLFCERAFSELTLALDSNSGNTGYQQSGKNFDLFIYNDAGTLRLCTGPAWTNDTTRAAALARLRGLLVNNASITLKYDATSATLTAAANSALYVGTMRASANGQTEMSLGAPAAAVGGTNNKLYLWNAYQRVPTSATCRDSTDTWTYTTAAWREKNASTSNAVNFVSGLAEGAVRASASAITSSDTSGIRRINGIGLNNTTAIAAGCITGYIDTQAGRVAQGVATYAAPVALGLSTLTELEQSVATGVSTWYGDGGGATQIQTGMTVELMM